MRTIHSTRRTSRWAILAVAVALVVVGAACGSDNGSKPESSPTTTTRANHAAVQLVGCQQTTTDTGVDKQAATKFVPANEELYLDPQGQARVSLIAKRCDGLVVDGSDYGSGHFNTLWVRIVGPDETRTFPDTPTVHVLPTDYYVPQFLETDNKRFAAALNKFGVPMHRADMRADPPEPGTQTGSVVDATYKPPLSYHWQVENSRQVAATLGVVHVLHGLDAQGNPLTYDIECVIKTKWFANPITVTFAPGSDLQALVGTGWTSLAGGSDLECQVPIDRNPDGATPST